jgi:hypothetical protein
MQVSISDCKRTAMIARKQLQVLIARNVTEDCNETDYEHLNCNNYKLHLRIQLHWKSLLRE